MSSPDSPAVDRLLRFATERAAAKPRFPGSTYRLQFHAGFTFRDATAIVPYLKDLGVTHLYASPYLKARPGSTHGYDVVDQNQLNPELGTRADYDAWVAAMSAAGLSHVLDTVPNHMGVGTNENAWWNDVLEHGKRSPFAHYFDIAWDAPLRPEYRGKVLLPVLGGLYGDVLDKGEPKLTFDLAAGSFAVEYFDRRIPIDPATYGLILCSDADDLHKALGEGHAEWREYAGIIAAASNPHMGELSQVKGRLADLVRRNSTTREFVEKTVRDFNGPPAANHHPLDNLLNHQNYRLAYWRVAPDEINYRRFFDINDLAALSMEHEDVFEAAHGLTLKLVADGAIAGLRVDHPDGLYDPKQYFLRLQQHAVVARAKSAYEAEGGRADGWPAMRDALLLKLRTDGVLPAGDGPARWPLYVVGEKILALDEPLPPDWAVHGTSGYDALNMISGLFVDPAGEKPLTELYADLTGSRVDVRELIYEKKKLILQISLASELNMLARQLDAVARNDRHSRDFTLAGLTDALRELIAGFPVYRSYVSDEGVRPEDVALVEKAVAATIAKNPKIEPAVFHFIRDVILQKLPAGATDDDRAAYRRFAGKFQQVTSPVMAKGIEDTAFYIYNRLISLNEVGGEPAKFGIPPAELHAYFADRQANWPYAMSVLSTHDTKRSEDVRTRIHALSELPGEWRERVDAWSKLNARHRSTVNGSPAPTANEEYLIYQTLVGVWPFVPAEAGKDKVVERVQAYLVKAMREAKVNTSWTSPNADHESAVDRFITAVLDEKANADFFREFLPFQQRVSRAGMVTSLAQTLIRLTAPGVPDTYQGTELWDLSLVDPDNRRPVDYARRAEMLSGLKSATEGDGAKSLPADLLTSAADGRLKLYVTWATLAARKANADLFSTGKYVPLTVTGERADHVFAFARVGHKGQAAIVVVPRLSAKLAKGDGWPVGSEAWGDTQVQIPAALIGTSAHSAFGGATAKLEATILAATLLSPLPIGLWVVEAKA